MYTEKGSVVMPVKK